MLAIRTIAFDFDGVLADSVPIKDGALHALVQHHDQATQVAALASWNRLKGVFRRDRIRAVYQEVLGQTLADEVLDGYFQQFSTQVFERTVAAPWIAGADAFLKGERGYPLYVVSASPQDEVRRVIERRGAADRFQAIYGGPMPKPHWLTQILQQEGGEPASLLFLGDSLSDHVAAVAVGTTFLGVVAPGNANPFPASVVTVPDLTHLDSFLIRV